MHLIDYASTRIVFSIAYFSSDLLLVLRAIRMRSAPDTIESFDKTIIIEREREQRAMKRKERKKPLSTNHLLIRENVKLFIW